MKRTLTSALIAAPLVVAGTFATAGGLAEAVVAPAPAPVAVAPVIIASGKDWTGAYAGLSLGYGDVDADGVDGDFEGTTFGGHVGYNYDLGNVVLGAEFEAIGTDDFTNDETGLELDQVLRAKVRAGYDAGNFLPYVAAGVAQATVDGDEDEGYFYGVGVDYAVSDSFTVGAEYLRHEFEEFNGGEGDISADTAALRVSYNF
ncbi:opacity protein-like surface antigen [Loktanella ponticola]|uniref:Opacity protein-like surface antigen n=1 Tax=Yoonia ponticola TaxID=1524255 RepID=A0A7W9BK01_9RHOB|nr:outer membrane beta-barrel protein [Yoonia ponticola]MBB5721652.1 opacity protein-like surface antigen [Yoonia ponticola]